RSTFTGLTSPPLISRRLASPEAETRSHWPPPPPPPARLSAPPPLAEPPARISAAISFDEPASLRWILQPLCCSNFLAKLGSEEYRHSIRLSPPYPPPIDDGGWEGVD